MISLDELVANTPLVTKNGDYTSPLSIEQLECYIEHALLTYAVDRVPFKVEVSVQAMPVVSKSPEHYKLVEEAASSIRPRIYELKRDLISMATQCIERAFSSVCDHAQRNAVENRVVTNVTNFVNTQAELSIAMASGSIVTRVRC